MKRSHRNVRRAAPRLMAGSALAAIILMACSGAAAIAPPDLGTLYKTTFVRAAPGRLLELIELYKTQLAFHDAAGDERPLWWRHSQGDQWDLMLLYPMGTYAEYYAPTRVERRNRAAAAKPEFRDLDGRIEECTSWTEDVFVMGPSKELVKDRFRAAAYYHIEIMQALPGKKAELIRERERESVYQQGIGRPALLIFVRDQGAAWDVYTLGCYENMRQWANSPEITPEARAEAARKADFDSPDAIGPYMRSLIVMHRDTHGGAIR